jgi:hypothetical protein
VKGRTPTAQEKQWMDDVQSLGCIVCRRHGRTETPAEIHHIDGKTKQGAHFHVLPLCYFHHRQGSDSELFTSRHPYKRRFEERYGPEMELLFIVEEMVMKLREDRE